MGRRVLFAFLVALALPLAARAQCRWWGEYRFHGDYDRTGSETLWMFEQELDGRYTFPVLDYTVGSLTLEGGLFQASGSRFGYSGSVAGLGRYGATLDLFPYRSFPITLYYLRESRPDFLDLPSWSSEQKGARITWTHRWVGKLNVDYQINTTEWGGVDRDLTTWRVEQVRHFGEHGLGSLSYESVEEAQFGEARTQDRGLYEYQLTLPGDGTVLARTYYDASSSPTSEDQRWSEHVYWNQPLGEKWRLLTWGRYEDGRSDWWNTTAHSLSATLYRDVPRLRLFGGGSYGARTYDWTGGLMEKGTTYQAFGGGTWFANDLWALTADASVGSETSTGRAFGPAGTRPTLTLHLGAARNADLPTWASSLAFAFRDISFDRRMYEAFPPGYLPPELEGVRKNYFQTHRQGVSTFEADFYHHEENGDYQSDRLTLTGRLKFNHTLHATSQIIWHRYQGAQAGEGDLKSLYLSTEYYSPKGYNAGLFATFAQVGAPAYSQLGGHSFQTDTTYSIGASFGVNLWGRVPLTTILALRKTTQGDTEYDFRLIGGFHYGFLDMRWVYQYYRDVYGVPRHTLRFDLLRLFRGNAF